MAFKIVKPAEAIEGADVILYGPPGVGKTSTADDPKFKTLLIDLEGGSAVLGDAKSVDRVPVDTYETLVEVGKAIESGEISGYDMVVMDSITRFEDLIKDYIVRKYAPNRRRGETKKFGDSSMQDWGDLKDLAVRMFKWFHGFTKRGEQSVHLVWIAHEADRKEKLQGTDAEVVVGKKIQFQGGDTAIRLMALADGFFYMYNKNVQGEDGKVSIERGIVTTTIGHLDAKHRISKHREPLPPRIVNPVWSDIFEKLGYVRKESKPLVSSKTK